MWSRVMKAEDATLAALAVAAIAFAVWATRKGPSRVEVVENTPAPKHLEDFAPPGVGAGQAAALQRAISGNVPAFDHASAVRVPYTDAEAKAVVSVVLDRANERENRFTLIGRPDASKFADKQGVLMYRLGFSIYDALDNAGARLEAVVYNGPADLGTCVAHLRHASKRDDGALAPAEEREVPGLATYESPFEHLARFAAPSASPFSIP